MYWMNGEAIEYLRKMLGNDEERRMDFENMFFGSVKQYCSDILIGSWTPKKAANEASYFAPESAQQACIKTNHRKEAQSISSDGAGLILTYKTVMQMHQNKNELHGWQQALEETVTTHPEKEVMGWVLR